MVYVEEGEIVTPGRENCVERDAFGEFHCMTGKVFNFLSFYE